MTSRKHNALSFATGNDPWDELIRLHDKIVALKKGLAQQVSGLEVSLEETRAALATCRTTLRAKRKRGDDTVTLALPASPRSVRRVLEPFDWFATNKRRKTS